MLRGTRLSGATKVDLSPDGPTVECGAAAPCQAVSDTEVQLTTPPHERGTFDVRVTTAAGRSPVVRTPGGDDDEFTYTPDATPSGNTGFNGGAGGFDAGSGTPAPPGGFSSAPVPGSGFLPGTGFNVAPGAVPTPGGGGGGAATSTGVSQGLAGPPAGGAPPPAPAAPTPGFVPPAGSSPPAPAAGPVPDVGGASPAAHYNMVAKADDEEANLMAAAAGILFLGSCAGLARRRHRPGPAVAPAYAYEG
ncbi:MAG: hypothetical protein ABR511_01310 [Acidimicrobiales bacterium]